MERLLIMTVAIPELQISISRLYGALIVHGSRLIVDAHRRGACVSDVCDGPVPSLAAYYAALKSCLRAHCERPSRIQSYRARTLCAVRLTSAAGTKTTIGLVGGDGLEPPTLSV